MKRASWPFAVPLLTLALSCGVARAEWVAVTQPAVDHTSIQALVVSRDPQLGLLEADGEGAFVTELPDVGLWKFIASVRAMQSEDPLLLLQGHLSILESTSPPPTVVPLPPAAWLLVTGLLGLAGVRLSSRRKGRTPSAPRTPVQQVTSMLGLSH